MLFLLEEECSMRLTDVVDQCMIDCENRNRSKGTLALYQSDLGLMVQWLGQADVVELEVIIAFHL